MVVILRGKRNEKGVLIGEIKIKGETLEERKQVENGKLVMKERDDNKEEAEKEGEGTEREVPHPRGPFAKGAEAKDLFTENFTGFVEN